MTGNETRSEILDRLADILVKSFEIERAAVLTEALMKDDLGLDSIDAIDLAVGLEESEGVQLSEDELREIRRVGDVVELVYAKLHDAHDA
jgi:acyl carrier protein